MRLYIIRHAEPDYPNDTLTGNGHREARALAKYLKALGIDALYSSPLTRARITAQYAADALGKDIGIEDWTHEWSLTCQQKPYDHLRVWDLPGEIIRAEPDNHEFPAAFKDPLLDQEYARIIRGSDGFLARQGYVREGARYRIAKGNRKRIALFCHNGFGLVWLAHLLHLPLALTWSGFWFAPSSVTTLLFDERSAQWATPRCIGLCDTTHLHNAGLPISMHGIKANFE